MNRIIKLHGCSGAGKTTAVRLLMAESELKGEVAIGLNRILYYKYKHPEVETPIYILGSYTNVCGGLDTISAASQVMDLIDRLHPEGHILMEGLLASTYYGKMGEHSQQFKDDYIYVFLNTPIEECIERVRKRRERAKETRPFNDQLTRDKWDTITALQKKLISWGTHRVETLDWKDEKPAHFLVQLLLR